jgi:tetratricopeptide (TPR) repeat protein
VSASDPATLGARGKRAFKQRRFDEAAQLFRQAADGFTLGRSGLLAAEMKNNESVALVQAGRPGEALEAARGTDIVFAGAQDRRREAMALGNLAAAHEAVGDSDQALLLYQRSADGLAAAGERDLRATVLKAMAGIRLRQGRLTEAGTSMIGALEAEPRPNLLHRALRSLLRIRR